MWYVIQVFTGTEEKTADRCRSVIGIQDEKESVLRKCFIPYVIRKRRYCGAWHEEKKILFPGYVFLVSDDPGELFLRLKKVPGLTKLLGTGDEIVPLSETDEALLKKLGGEDQIVEGSIGILEQDRIIIMEGPLQGMEGLIKKIDRHKRAAWLEVKLMGMVVETQVGLEIVKKR